MLGDAPVVVDLFSGAGGLSLGFAASGCLIRAAVDIDPAAGNTFRANFTRLQPDRPPVVFTGEEADLKRLGLEKILAGQAPDLLIGGPPCQAFSRLGRGKLDSLSEEGFVGDPRNQLYQKFLEAVEHWRPRAVVMENVTGMLSVAGTNYAVLVNKELSDLGYRTGYAVMNAVWFGVPQYRERLFFLAIREDLGISPKAPATTHASYVPEGYLKPRRDLTARMMFDDAEWDRVLGELPLTRPAVELPAVTVQEAIGDLPALTSHLDRSTLPRGDFRKKINYHANDASNFPLQMRNWPGLVAPDIIEDQVTRRTPRDYQLFRRMKPGDRYPDALKLVHEHEQLLFEKKLQELGVDGSAPKEGSTEWKKIRAVYIPPYDEKSFLDKWRKLIPDQPSWTIPAHLGKDSYSHIHYDSEQARMITPREAARLQSFPDAFAFEGSIGDCFRQIGNAVPPLLSLALARALLPLLGFTGSPAAQTGC